MGIYKCNKNYKNNIGFMNHILTVGDTVQVMAKPAATPMRGIWPGAWNDITMTPLIGQIMTIKSIHADSIAVEENEWLWPAFVLKRIDQTPDYGYNVNVGIDDQLIGAGARVRVERAPTPDEYWPAAWYEQWQGPYLGKDFTVREIRPKGVVLNGCDWLVPAFVLRVLPDKTKATPSIEEEYNEWFKGVEDAKRQEMEADLTSLLIRLGRTNQWYPLIDTLLKGNWPSDVAMKIKFNGDHEAREFFLNLRFRFNSAGKVRVNDHKARQYMGVFLDQRVRQIKELGQSTNLRIAQAAHIGHDLAAAPLPTTIDQSRKHKQDTTMTPTKIEHRTYVSLGGAGFANAADMTDDNIIAHIAQVEQEIERLKQIKAKPQALKNKIAELQAGIDALVELLDARTETTAKKK